MFLEPYGDFCPEQKDNCQQDHIPFNFEKTGIDSLFGKEVFFLYSIDIAPNGIPFGAKSINIA